MNLSESVDERPPQHELAIPMSQIHNHPPCLSLVSVGFVVLWLRGGVLAGGPLLGVCLTACFLAGGVGVCFFGGRFLWCPYGVSCVSFFSFLLVFFVFLLYPLHYWCWVFCLSFSGSICTFGLIPMFYLYMIYFAIKKKTSVLELFINFNIILISSFVLFS